MLALEGVYQLLFCSECRVDAPNMTDSALALDCCLPELCPYGLQGLWWMPSIADADSLQPLKGGMAMAALEGERGPGGAELLKLAAAQRMSTDARRAAFCVVMGSEDYIDASDRLLRLPLKACLQAMSSATLLMLIELCLQELSNLEEGLVAVCWPVSACVESSANTCKVLGCVVSKA